MACKNFLHFIFPCANIFFLLRPPTPPPHNFSNGPLIWTKTQVKLFTNFTSIPFDYLLISRVTLRKNKRNLSVPMILRNKSSRCSHKFVQISDNFTLLRLLCKDAVNTYLISSNCSNIKGNNIWTYTSPCERRAASISCAPLVKEGGKGISRCHFQNNQN